jgi:hypothetical protein
MWCCAASNPGWETDMGGTWFNAKKKQKNCDPITKNKLGIAVHICNLSYSRGGRRRITRQKPV